MSSTLASSFPTFDDQTARPDAGLAGTMAPAGTAGNGTGGGQELLARAVHGAHDTIDRLADTAAPHVQRLQEGVASAADAVQSRAGELRDAGDEWAEALRVTVRENPLAALAAALAMGMLVARLTRR